MKTLKLFVIAFAAISINACAQKPNVPENVDKAFTQKFPDAKSVKWDKENETEWEAEFKLNGLEYSANYSTEGVWKETEHEIQKSDIPTNVKQTLDTEFPDYKIKESEISETTEGSVYEFELEKEKVKMEVAVSPDGKVVKKEVKTANDDDKE